MKSIGPILLSVTLALFGLAQANAQDSGRVTLVVGNVTMIPPAGGVSEKLSRGQVVQAGAMIQTGPKSRAVIMMTGSSAIRISENSQITLARMDDAGAGGESKVKVDLNQGSVGALIDSNKKRQIDFKIETPHGVATARGTFYAVIVKDGKTYTKVAHGKVGVTTK